MKAISIKQPWAWALCNGKPVENRNWRYPPKYRGPILIHASKTFDHDGWLWIVNHANSLDLLYGAILPEPDTFKTGGIVAVGTLTDVVTEMDSPWFFGPLGLVIPDAKPVPFFPCRGQLGIFEVEYPYELEGI